MTTADYVVRHENYLTQVLEKYPAPSSRLQAAMIYVLFPGGKRLRPLLVYLVGELLQTNLECLDVIAASIELTHSYSLVHDDLPAMDNDDFRRGKPSCHRQFGEGTAILVGDALQILAIEILMVYLSALIPAEKIINVTQILTQASGAAGMIGGQCLDLYELSSANQADLAKTTALLLQIHELKTGQLIMACINMVIAASPKLSEDGIQQSGFRQDASERVKGVYKQYMAGGERACTTAENVSAKSIKALQHYAYHLGLAFQMQDDYLDQYAAPTALGKGRSSDQSNQKTTFAACYTQFELKNLIAKYYQTAQDSLQHFGEKAAPLLELTQGLMHRI